MDEPALSWRPPGDVSYMLGYRWSGMGPPDSRSTMEPGLARGHVAGVIGSSDHHGADPGEHLGGNRHPERLYLAGSDYRAARGAQRPASGRGAFLLHRAIAVDVTAASAVDDIELLERNHPIHRWGAHHVPPAAGSGAIKALLRLG